MSDGDPIDLVELSFEPFPIGAVCNVRVLGAIGLVDQGECDWKVLCIRLDEPQASQPAPVASDATADSLLEQHTAKLNHHTLHTVDDVPPEIIQRVIEWYRDYKTIEGKPSNSYVPNTEEPARGFVFSKDQTARILAHAHQDWCGRQREPIQQ
ncbi:inorganic diphosphatase [Fonticula alba]|uniref:inorganic diphosphatase n=1 Tax=Fonticula alba TaxID=691883 RepID=A0A058ZIQ8_FONAL|nr:inorganic diphosphatase [Fonticula alba]KCV73402.1 inorganic diphosphatase [Fonticula alba]|eukprot:XP_009493103.1 inorganic diphosphatase [Fonticula alba]